MDPPLHSQPAQSGPRCRCQPSDSNTRNLAVFIDGTSNQFSKKNTNVVELYSRLVKNQKQLTFYNSGIGTYAAPHFWSWRYQKQKFRNAADLALAWNFEPILLDAYVWLSENYEEGDRIFLFGFSRGAYQVRALSAMIDMVGLIHKGNQAQVPFAFQLYAQTKAIEDIDAMRSHFKRTFSRDAVVHFVGAWDTVSSVGLIRDKTLPKTTDGMKHVCFFRHALALHERRVKFLPEYACGGQGPDESETLPVNGPQPHTKEVWFAGTHSDVGGGVEENAQMNRFGPALRWMSFEALLAGVQLGPAAPEWKAETQNIHNSLSFGWWLLECLPLTQLSYQDPPGTTSSSIRRRHRCSPRQVRRGQLIHETAFNSLMGPPLKQGAAERPHVVKKYLFQLPAKAAKKLVHRCAYAVSPLVAGGKPWDGSVPVPADPWCAQIGFGAAAIANITEKDPYTASKDIVERIHKTDPKDDISDSDFIAFKELTSTEPGRRSLRESPDIGAIIRIILSKRMAHLAQTMPGSSSTFVNTARALALAFDAGALDLVSTQDKEYAPGDLRPLAAVVAQKDPVAATRFMRIFAKALIHQSTELKPDAPISSYEWSAAYFPSGKRIFTGRNGGQLVIYEVDSSVVLKSAWFGPREPVCCVAVSQTDEQCLASGNKGGALTIWNLNDNVASPTECRGHSDTVHSVAFSPDGKQLASASSDFSIIIWNAATGVPNQKPLMGHLDTVYSVAWTPNGKCLASGSGDNTVRLWDTDSGYLSQTLRGHSRKVRCVAFSPNGNRLVSGSRDMSAIVWDVSSGQQILSLVGHREALLSLSFSPDGYHIASGAQDGTVRAWNAATGEEEDRLPVLADYMRSVRFSPDGKRIASACGNLQLWDAKRWDYAETLDAQPAPNRDQTSAPPAQPHTSPAETLGLKAQTPGTPAPPDETPAPPAQMFSAFRAGLDMGRKWAGWLNVV